MVQLIFFLQKLYRFYTCSWY